MVPASQMWIFVKFSHSYVGKLNIFQFWLLVRRKKRIKYVKFLNLGFRE